MSRTPVKVKAQQRVPWHQKLALLLSFVVPGGLTLFGLDRVYSSLEQFRSGFAAVAVSAIVAFGFLLLFITATNWYIRRGAPELKREKRNWRKTFQVAVLTAMAMLLIVSALFPLLDARSTDQQQQQQPLPSGQPLGGDGG